VPRPAIKAYEVGLLHAAGGTAQLLDLWPHNVLKDGVVCKNLFLGGADSASLGRHLTIRFMANLVDIKMGKWRPFELCAP